MRPYSSFAFFSMRLLALGAVLLAAGCSTLDVPHVENHPSTVQKKARAVHHWDVLAQDVARRIAEKISDWPPQEHPLSMATVPDSAFSEGFRKLLIGHLLDRGVVLSTEPTAAQLHVDTQLVQHGVQAGGRSTLAGTRLAAGVAVERDAERYRHGTGAGRGAGAVTGSGDAQILDAAYLHQGGEAASKSARMELLITTSIQSGGRYLTSTADIYYIERFEAELYRTTGVSPMQPPVPAVKAWQVVTP